MFGRGYFSARYFGPGYFGPSVITAGKPYYEKKKLKTLEEKQQELIEEVKGTTVIEKPVVTSNREFTEANLNEIIAANLKEEIKPQDDIGLLLAIIEATS